MKGIERGDGSKIGQDLLAFFNSLGEIKKYE
jgi:hypothetical protein